MKAIRYTFFLVCMTDFLQADPVSLKAKDGRSITATVTGVENGEILITKQDGKVYRLPLNLLDEASKKTVEAEIAKTAEKPESGAIQNQQEQLKNARKSPVQEYTVADMENAYYTSREFIKKALKAPSTAKFSNPISDNETTGSAVTNEGRIKSKGVVEAQNSFGSPLRKSWTVIVQSEGKQWRIVYAVLGEDTLMDTRKDHKTGKTLNAESFIGMTKKTMIAELGEPSETTTGINPEDGAFTLYTYSKEKNKEILFTIWDSDGTISSGSYEGTYFSK